MFLGVLLASLSVIGCGKHAANEINSPKINACYSRLKDSNRCGTSFSRLMLNPESARGKNVALVGFLAQRNGVALLYPSEQDYLNDEIYNSVIIEAADLSVLNDKWYRLVRVRAHFDPSHDPANAWFGVLTNLDSAEIIIPVEREEPVIIHDKIKS